LSPDLSTAAAGAMAKHTANAKSPAILKKNRMLKGPTKPGGGNSGAVDSSKAARMMGTYDMPRNQLSRLRVFLFGKPKDLMDQSIFTGSRSSHFWLGRSGSRRLVFVGVRSRGSVQALGTHTYLAVLLAAMTALTVIIISAATGRIIEEFPHGGGGYVVASKLLGKPIRRVSGSALLVDYMLTIAISIAAAGDAIFSFLPPHLHALRVPFEICLISSSL